MTAMYRQGKLYAFSATGFLYSLIIVDLYRKLVGTNVESIRNMVYMFFFTLLLIDMYKTKKLGKMLALCGVVLLLFGISIVLNPGYSAVYTASIFLFVSRLWPAYYIGRYSEDWDTMCRYIMLFSPIALVYAVSLFVMPDIAGGQAYATIASNLAFVTMISLFASIYYRRLIGVVCSIVCLVPVFFYGTRVFFLGVIVSLVLAYVINMNSVSRKKRVLLISLLALLGLILLSAGDLIFERLYQWFPNSRTLQMMEMGDVLDDSNRSYFYERLRSSLSSNPFKIYGFIGDRIYLSELYDSPSEILSNFSHNCILELCMNFGMPIGVLLSVFFIYKLIKSLRISFKIQNAVNYVYVLVLGACFMDMMLSASYMSAYAVWLLFGLAFSICEQKAWQNNAGQSDVN